jgi:hypothetical protein
MPQARQQRGAVLSSASSSRKTGLCLSGATPAPSEIVGFFHEVCPYDADPTD